MEEAACLELLRQAEDLSDEQRQRLDDFVAGRHPHLAVTAAIETSVQGKRLCPHCGHERVNRSGVTSGLQRFFCKGCRKSFNALTGTPLSSLHMRGLWPDFGQSLANGENMVKLAKRFGVAPSTAYRWRERFSDSGSAPILTGIAKE